MGYAVPGAIGAWLVRPDNPAIALVGDGGFMMTGQELATAMIPTPDSPMDRSQKRLPNTAHGHGDDKSRAAYTTRLGHRFGRHPIPSP